MAVSSGLSLAFMVIGLLAVVFALVVVWRRTPATKEPQLSLGRDLSQLDTEAEHVRARAEAEAAGILDRARSEAEQAAQGRREVEEEIRAVKDEVRELRGDLERREVRLAEREQRLDTELERIEDRAQALDARKHDLDRRAAELDRLNAERTRELERIAGLTTEAAKGELVAAIENQAKREAALIVRDIENEAKSEGEQRARKIVTLAIQRVATEQTSESVVSVLHLPGDEMKGRIIGREGRNIRAFESVTGVNLIIDDTPEAVLLSCFDPVRARSPGSPWSGSSPTAASTRSGSRTPTSGARPRSSSCASGPGKTPWSSSDSPTCTQNWSASWAACGTAPPTARTCCGTWSSRRTSRA